jgi:hypothetical protein
MFDPHQSPMTVVNELPLKLTRKCVDAFGVDISDQNNSDRRTICKCFDSFRYLSHTHAVFPTP